MSESKRPEDFGINWNYDSPMVPTVRSIIMTTPMPWIQIVTELSYCLAAALVGCEDGDERLRIGENLAAAILDVGETGEMPDEFRPSGGPDSPSGVTH